MKRLKGELIRFQTDDGLELQGILYIPSSGTQKAVIHIHGWTGNFYENVFIAYIANACLSKGYAFLSFNTRGAGFVQEFLRKKDNAVKYVKIGGSLEKFEDCLIDIEAAISFLHTQGFNKFILEGHSTGCQKALYYANKSNEHEIEGLIFLEPADDPSIVKNILAERYIGAIQYATKLVEDGKQNGPMPEWVGLGVNLAAQKFLSIADPKSTEGKLLHLYGELEELKSISCPILVISSDSSEYQDAKSMQERIKEIAKNLTASIISDSGHWFFGHEKEVGEVVSSWLGKTQE